MSEFWSLTFREIDLVISGHAKCRERDLDLAYYNAWHGGLFSQGYKAGKFPDYYRHAPNRRRRPVQSAEQQKMIILQLHQAFGGQLVRKENS